MSPTKPKGEDSKILPTTISPLAINFPKANQARFLVTQLLCFSRGNSWLY